MLVVSGMSVFAQECIPNTLSMSKDVFACLKAKDTQRLKSKFIQWEEVLPLYEAIAAQEAGRKDKYKTDLPPIDSFRKEFEIRGRMRFYENIDSVFARIKRVNVDITQCTFFTDRSKILVEKDLPDGFWSAETKLKFASGDSIFVINYTSLLVNNQWKIVEYRDEVGIEDKFGLTIGNISTSFDDYNSMVDSMVTDPTFIVDSAVAETNQNRTATKRSTSKSKPVKKTTAKPKQAIRKTKKIN